MVVYEEINFLGSSISQKIWQYNVSSLRAEVIFELNEKPLSSYLMPERSFIWFCWSRSTYFLILELFPSENVALDRSSLQ